jgi:hypothetical protein
VNTEIIRKALEIGLANTHVLADCADVRHVREPELDTIRAALAELDGAEARPEANEILDRALRFGNVPVHWTCAACKSRHEWWWKPLDVQAGEISMRCPNCTVETPCLMDRDGKVKIAKKKRKPKAAPVPRCPRCETASNVVPKFDYHQCMVCHKVF